MGQNEHRALLASIGALCFSTFALGSAPRWAVCVGAAVAVLAAVPIVGSRRRPATLSPIIVLAGIALGATALQLIPLPSAIVEAISPTRYAIAAANAKAFRASIPRAMPLSYDWPATLVECAKFSGYLSIAFLATRLSSSRRARKWLVLAVACAGIGVAVCALGHRIIGAKSLFGLYRPQVAYAEAISPFFNPNHLAGYLAFISPICLGLAIHRRSWFFSISTLVCAVTSVQAISRGGMVSLAVGMLVAILLLVLGQQTKTRTRFMLVLAGLAAVILGLWGSTAGQQLLKLNVAHEQDAGKFVAWGEASKLLSESPWVGVGRGGFEAAFTRFQPPTGVTFSHIENEYLQAAIDWGFPLAIVMLLALLALARAIWRRRPFDAVSAGSLGGIAAILVQNSVDFGLQLPGVAVPSIIIVATLIPGKLQIIPLPHRRPTQLLRLAAISGGVLVSALAVSALGAPAALDIERAAELTGSHVSVDQVTRAAAHLAERHPASYQVPARAAAVLWKKNSPAAFSTLARALALNPEHQGVHLLSAEMLVHSQRPRQAIAEYRASMRHTGPRPAILQSAQTHFPDAADLLLLVSDKPEIAQKFVPAFLLMGRPDVAMAATQQILRVEKRPAFRIFAAGVEAAIQLRSFALAVQTATRAHHQISSEKSLLLLARAHQAASRPLLAIAALEAEASAHSSPPVLDLLSKLQVDVGDFESAHVTTSLLLAAASENREYRPIAHARLATIEDHKGNRHQAKWHRQQAALK